MLVLLSSILAFIVANPAAVALISAGIGFLIRLLLQKLAKDKAAKYESNLLAAVSLAYDLVNDYAKKSPNTVDDKIVAGLLFVKEALAPKKQELSAADEAKARALFHAMHGRQLIGQNPHDVIKEVAKK